MKEVKLAEEFKKDYKAENRNEGVITITPFDAKDMYGPNALCKFTVRATIFKENYECNGTLVENWKGDDPQRGNLIAHPDGDEDGLDMILNELFSGDPYEMDEAIAAAYAEGLKPIAKMVTFEFAFTPEAATGEWDKVEVHPMLRFGDGQEEAEQCEEGEAQFWSVFLHQVSGGLSCVADMPSKEAAHALALLLEISCKYYKPTK